jgi:methionyl-tRNA formyltransferase
MKDAKSDTMLDAKAPRILFAGNPELSVPALQALAQRFPVVGVLTNPDRPVGRGRHIEMPPVKRVALELGIPVVQAERVRREAREHVAALAPDLLISFACSHIFGPKFLSLFPRGAINIHPSLLPAYRGCAPLQFALLHGERTTGITIQRIVQDIDSGNVLASEKIILDGTETTLQLEGIVAPKAADLIVRTVQDIIAGNIVEIPQDHQKASYTRMLEKADGTIDWHDSCVAIHSKVRALFPWPKADTTFHGTRLLITGVYGSVFDLPHELLLEPVKPGTVLRMVKKKGLAVACGDGVLYVTRVQLAQKKEMDSAAFLNGNPSIIGAVLGTDET